MAYDSYVCYGCATSVSQQYRLTVASTTTVVSTTPTTPPTTRAYVARTPPFSPVRSNSKRLKVLHKPSPMSQNSRISKSCTPTVQSPQVHVRRRKSHDTSISVANNIKQSHYYSAFHKLLSTGPAARRAFNDIVNREAKVEMKRMLQCEKNNPTFPRFDGVKSIETFSWSTVIGQMNKSLPLLWSAVRGSMPLKVFKGGDKARCAVLKIYLIINCA